MSNLEDWPYKWFGLWSENGSDYADFPSIKEFVFPDVNHSYDLEKLLNYLRNAECIVSTTRSDFPHPFTGEIIPFRGLLIRSDGVWQWFSDLPEYIENYDVAIPTKFLEHIKANGFMPPTDIDQETYMALEIPGMDFRKSDR
jgi:hypothetical protein